MKSLNFRTKKSKNQNPILFQKLRPTIPKRWVNHPLNLLIKECWSHEPKARPTMLNMKKRLKKLEFDNSALQNMKPLLEEDGSPQKYNANNEYNYRNEAAILPKIQNNSSSTVPMDQWVTHH